ncbi:MAG: RNA polymerase sigma factor, partial [Pseudomonadota bacterium]
MLVEPFETKGEIAYRPDPALEAPATIAHETVGGERNGVQAADRQAELLELYRAHHGALVKFVFKIVKDTALAEDIVQDTFIRFSRLEDASVVTHKRAFLYRMASNLSVDRLRQEKRRRTYSVSDTGENGFEENYLVSEAPSPEQTVAARQQFRKLLRLVDG